MRRLTIPTLPARLIRFHERPNMITQSRGDLEHPFHVLTSRSIGAATGVQRSGNLIEVAADRPPAPQ